MKSKLLQNTKAGIYLRLSNDDERAGESLSIENQRRILVKYVMEQGFELVDTYIDDGWSGTSFDRPGVKRLLEDAKIGRINVIVVKDDCVINARTPKPLENRHFLRNSTKFRTAYRPQKAAYHIKPS